LFFRKTYPYRKPLIFFKLILKILEIFIDLTESQKADILNELERELFEKNLIKKPFNRKILNEYDVIGFDIDHTLGIYNLSTLADLLYSSFTKFLIDHKNYPKILDIFDRKQEKENLSYESLKFLNIDNFFKLSGVDILVDLNHGNALKISHTGKILKGFHGIKELTEQEIKSFYGENMQIPENYNFNFEVSKNENYIYLQGYFEYHIPALYLFCVELLKTEFLNFSILKKEENSIFEFNQLKNDKVDLINPYRKIMSDIMDSLIFNYAITDKKMEETGYFYTEVSLNPKKYLCENSARETLISIKKLGIKIFYATNSYREFGDLIMKNSLGEDFLDLFDLCISFARKPVFFVNKVLDGENNFRFPEISLEKYQHSKEFSLMHLREDFDLFEEIKFKKSIITNSFDVVKTFFGILMNNNQLKYIYVGDSILNDCIAPVKHASIKSIAVIEFIDSFYHGIKPDHLAEYWKLESKKDTQQVHIFQARDHAEFSISNVQTLKLFC